MNPNPAQHLDSLYQVFQCCKTSQYFHLAITTLWYWMRSVLWCPWICPISWHPTRGSYSDQLSTACIRFNNVAQNQASLQNETTNSLNKDIRFFALLMSFVSILNGCRSLILYWQTHQICHLFRVFPFFWEPGLYVGSHRWALYAWMQVVWGLIANLSMADIWSWAHTQSRPSIHRWSNLASGKFQSVYTFAAAG